MQYLSGRFLLNRCRRGLAVWAGMTCLLGAVPGWAAPAAVADAPAVAGTAADPGQAVIARVNDTAILKQQLDEAVLASHQPDTPQLREALRTVLVDRELLRQAAQAAGLASAPGVVRAAGMARDDAMIAAYVQQSVPQPAVSDEAVRARYDDLMSDWGRYEYQAAIVSVSTPGDLAVVQQALKEKKPFGWVASRYSVAPNAAQGGVWPWTNLPDAPREGRTHGIPLEIARKLVAMKVGEVAGPVQVERNLVMVQLSGRRASPRPAYGTLAGALRGQLVAEARGKEERALVERLRQAARVQ